MWELGEKKDALCGRAEKLDVAFGLINTLEGLTLLPAKDLRMCNDCLNGKKLYRLERRGILEMLTGKTLSTFLSDDYFGLLYRQRLGGSIRSSLEAPILSPWKSSPGSSCSLAFLAARGMCGGLHYQAGVLEGMRGVCAAGGEKTRSLHGRYIVKFACLSRSRVWVPFVGSG